MNNTLKRVLIVAAVFALLGVVGLFVPINRNHGMLHVGDLRCSTPPVGVGVGIGYDCKDGRKPTQVPQGAPSN